MGFVGNFGDAYNYVMEHQNEVINFYMSEHDYVVVTDDDRHAFAMKMRDFIRTRMGFEMEVNVENWNAFRNILHSYHYGTRANYNGTSAIFATIERDGSLPSNGMEFITAQHYAGDETFFRNFMLFKELIMDKYIFYVNDRHGGHIHISGWDEDEYKAIYASLKAYTPLMIALFGNGEHGVRRENHYFNLIPTINSMANGSRSGVYVISKNHFELRFFDGETNPIRWYAREIIVDAAVNIGHFIMLQGIGRYVNVANWLRMMWEIQNENKYRQEDYNAIADEFYLNVKKIKYPKRNEIKHILFDANWEEYLEKKIGKAMPKIIIE